MKTPGGFIIIAVLLLLWNLMGVSAFIMQYSMDLVALAKTDPYQAQMFAQMPRWVWAAYAIAVGAGTIGAIALLMRRAMAAPLFALSLAAVLAQFGYSFFGTNLLAVKGWTAAIFPAVIIVLAVVQFLFARSMVARGALK